MFWNKNNKPGWHGSKLNEYGSALQSGDYSAIPRIFCVFAESHADTKTAAADMLYAALEKMTFDDLVRVDQQMRQTTSMEWSIDWRKLPIDDFFTPKMNEEARRAVIIFASFNPNGFIRERAVNKMKNHTRTLPFAILRLNDWVSQVREAANETAEYRLSNLSEGELIAALPFADKLGRSGRLSNVNTYMSRMYTALLSKNNEKELLTALNADNIRTRRICANALFNNENPRYDMAIERLQHETEPFLRASIFRKLVSAGQNLSVLSEQLLKDKYPLNRVLAFQYICDTDKDRALQAANQLLLDKNAVVREHARFYINSNMSGFDYGRYYKSHLEDCTAPAILGLSETGNVEDCNIIENYLQSLQIAIVRAAMIAVMKLDSPKYAATIIEFLADNRAGIVKTACNLILKVSVPDYTRVLEIFCATLHTNTKQKCFSILLTTGKWQRLIFILDVIETGGSEMEEKAIDDLWRWIVGYNRSYATAAPNQIAKIKESIKRLDLGENLKRQLLFLLR